MKKRISCAIVDDDLSAIHILEDYISQIPRLELLTAYTDPIRALTEVAISKVDLLFLDIDMPNMSGIQFAEALKHKVPNIIFTTAYSKYAIQAFDVWAKHYLLKPIELSKFADVVTHVISEYNDKCFIDRQDDDSLYLRTGERGKLTRVCKSDIIQIQAAGNYVQLLTLKNQYTIYMTIKEMDVLLINESNFYRVHKSNIINTRYIKRVIGNTIELEKYSVIMAAQYKEEFVRYLEEKTLVSKRV